MRKSFLSILAITVINLGAFTQSLKGQFVINGEIAGVKDGLLYLRYNLEDKFIIDSTRIVNGRFMFAGNLEATTRAEFMLKTPKSYDPDNNTTIWLEPAKMKIRVKLNEFASLKMTGSPTQLDYQEFMKVRHIVDDKYRIQLDSLKGLRDKEKIDAIRGRLAPYFVEMDKTELDFFYRYPQSTVTASMIGMHFSKLSLDTIRMFYERLGPKIQKNWYGRYMAQKIELIAASSPGSMAIDFSTLDIDGKLLRLSDFKGSYVLLDFWASWCVPCRKGNPHLRELYAKYKPKGIEFIGISGDDGTEDKWRQAVQKDSLPWRQVLRQIGTDPTQPKTNINHKYGISAIPVRILIDPKGKIIGRFEEDETKLDVLLKKEFGE
jgi:thiol-disulfide isomerase/thioredoxin